VFRSYVRVGRVPGLAVPMAASLLGALAINMQALAVLLLVRQASGSFGRAAIVAAVFSLGAAAGLVWQGRLLDRYGPARVLAGGSAVCGAALAVLTLAVYASPLPVLGLLAVLAGASVPAVPSAMRILVPHLVSDPDLRKAAYALLAVQFQAATIVGPLLTAGLLAAAGATVTVLCAAALAACAAAGFAATAARGPRGVRRQRHQPVASPGMRTLLVSALGLGAVSGLVGVGVPAVAVAHGTPSLAGVLLSVASVGSLAGGLLYGGRSWAVPMSHQLVLAQAAEAIAVALVWVCALAGPWWLVPALLLDGFTGSPVMIICSTMLDSLAPEGALAQAYTLLIATVLAGTAAGNYLAGVLVDHWGAPAAFPMVAGFWCLVAVWTLFRRRTLA
jgi:MFS family permease